MDSVNKSFSNQQIEINLLPDYQAIDFSKISIKKQQKSILQLSTLLVIFCIVFLVLYIQTQFIETFYIAGFLLFIFVLSYINIFLQQPVYAYAIREKDIAYRRGYWVTKTTLIPFNRVQHVSIVQGVFDKLLGISTLKIFTAGGQGSDISIPGLDLALAVKLKEAVAIRISVEEDE
ncbi:MAG: PH domain-containing protein [Mesonia hippocampi]|uniref:PH domain-containing protein n=1 Tax=Mesonia hippocampi TaxID=1628250 RepID=UPI003F98DE79